VPEPWPAWVVAPFQKIIRAFCDALDHARRFGRHEGGSMTIFTALTDIPLVFSVGAGIDYSASNMARAKLDGMTRSPIP
jgi:Flp pilus assembly protein TadG